nr:MAG TPA: RNA polymerase sigma factor [Caudoviricetes sp.]
MTNGYTTPESKISLFELAGNQKQYEQWLRGDDEADWKTHTIKALHSALENELTDAQRYYIDRFFFNGWTMREIAESSGVNSATVSRTINTGLDRLYHVLRYCNPRYLSFPQERKRERHRLSKKLQARRDEEDGLE